MHATQYSMAAKRRRRHLFAGVALLAALMVSGCSAVNMTGFSFPVFGLTKKSANELDGTTTASVPREDGGAQTGNQTLTSQ